MKIIFLGLMYSEKTLDYCKKHSKNGLQMATHVFQSNLLQGLESSGVNFKVVNIPPIGSFPINCTKLFFKGENWGKNNYQIPYLNLPIIKQKMQKGQLVKEIKKAIIQSKDKDVSIIAYSPYIPFLKAIKQIKKKYPFIKSNLIVTDCIPGREDMDKYMTKSAIKRGNEIVRLAKSIDSFSLLTKHLASALEIGDKPYVITECICNEHQKQATAKNKNDKICLYAGSISEEFGVDTLVDAFSKISGAELWVCGKSNSTTSIEHLQEMAKKHGNIKYLGFVSKEEVEDFRNKCDYLINPRMPTGTFTKYSFPSKTAEYMMSGKPTIMYKLEGVPDSYDEFLNYITETTSDKLKEEIESIFNKDYAELQEKALRARDFLINNNSSKKQVGKILETLKD